MNEPTRPADWRRADIDSCVSDAELMALDETPELMAQLVLALEEGRSIEREHLKFSDMLEMHKRQCRRGEERPQRMLLRR